MMLREVRATDDGYFIPVFDSIHECFIKFSHEDSLEEASNSGGLKIIAPYGNINKILRIKNYNVKDFLIPHVYAVFCILKCEKYFLVSFFEIEDADDLKHSVCIPFNKLNLYKFYKEYLEVRR